MAVESILVTGAAGYLGSHAMATLLRAGLPVIGVDNHRSSSPAVVKALEELCGKRPTIVRADLTDRHACHQLFATHRIGAVIHFAGLKSVAESMANPLLYYQVNVGATIALLDAMQVHEVRRLVFSSSCTVYGDVRTGPIEESTPVNPISPYGRTKATIECMLQDVCHSDPEWSVLALRYFNPIGADPSGLVGEDPSLAPTTLMPHLMRAALGDGGPLSVFGADYPTPDGSCVRDFIHVCDLIEGHVRALEVLPRQKGFETLNLGTGRGVSVLELIRTCAEAIGIDIPYQVVERRPGDAMIALADPTKAERVLGWRATRSLAEACADHFRWHFTHPDGFGAHVTE